MSQTNLKTDTCSFNVSAAPFFYTMMPNQYENTYQWGEVGINATGGTAGSYVRSDVIDISSFLSGRDEVLSRCNPPVPGLDEVVQQPMVVQNNDVSILISKETREKKSAVNLGAIDYNRWAPNLPVDPQDLRFIIEDFAPQRGGMNTTSYSKLAWDPTVKKGAAINSDPGTCRTILDPSRACGEYCSEVNGYMPNIIATPLDGKPQQNYPFKGPTSQNIYQVGGSNGCAENMFHGYNYTEGRCAPTPKQNVLFNN